MRGGWSTPRPGRLSPGKQTWHPLCSKLDGPQGRSGRVRKMSIQVTSRYIKRMLAILWTGMRSAGDTCSWRYVQLEIRAAQLTRSALDGDTCCWGYVQLSWLAVLWTGIRAAQLTRCVRTVNMEWTNDVTLNYLESTKSIGSSRVQAWRVTTLQSERPFQVNKSTSKSLNPPLDLAQRTTAWRSASSYH